MFCPFTTPKSTLAVIRTRGTFSTSLLWWIDSPGGRIEKETVGFLAGGAIDASLTLDIKGHICPRQVRINVDVINIEMDEDGKEDVQIVCVKKVRSGRRRGVRLTH